MDIFFWNIWGLNDPLKHQSIWNWIQQIPLSFGALLETHIQDSNLHLILLQICTNLSCHTISPHSINGRIWLLSDGAHPISIMATTDQMMSCIVQPGNGLPPFHHTIVYAKCYREDKEMLWESLIEHCSVLCLNSLPWLVVGDFNEIIRPEETSNQYIHHSSPRMVSFANRLHRLNLFDLTYRGAHFTWTNKQSANPIAKKLDRCLVNDNWLVSFPSSFASFEPPKLSDHTPCHIRISPLPPTSFGTKPFQFFNHLTSHPLFNETLSQTWTLAGGKSSSLALLCVKLKSIKNSIRALSKDKYSDIERKVRDANEFLKLMLVQALYDPS